MISKRIYGAPFNPQMPLQHSHSLYVLPNCDQRFQKAVESLSKGKKSGVSDYKVKIVGFWLTSTKISTRNSTVFFTDLALWPNGKAFDFESKDSGFDPQRGHQL